MRKEIFDNASALKLSEKISRDKNGVYRYEENGLIWHFLSLKQLNQFLEVLENEKENTDH
ncbi:MAG: hypothetical protein ACYTFG_13160 [Planctomycetota bacterium]|jgi:ribosome-binding protein aMBF1 (putative translation factor)